MAGCCYQLISKCMTLKKENTAVWENIQVIEKSKSKVNLHFWNNIQKPNKSKSKLLGYQNREYALVWSIQKREPHNCGVELRNEMFWSDSKQRSWYNWDAVWLN